MNLQMMEGLLGASSHIKLSDTPMSVYRQANAGRSARGRRKARRRTVPKERMWCRSARRRKRR